MIYLTKTHEHSGLRIAEVIGDGVIIETVDDAFQIMVDVAHATGPQIIFHQENFSPAFFDLKTRLLGEFLQKTVNYKIQVAFVGNFSNVESKSLRDFIFESNRGRQHFFLGDLDSAIQVFQKKTI